MLRSCGWEVCTDPLTLESLIASREAVGEYERAALMALFQAGAHPSYREIERAVHSLRRGGSAAGVSPARAAALRMMCMVVAGYQPQVPLARG